MDSIEMGNAKGHTCAAWYCFLQYSSLPGYPTTGATEEAIGIGTSRCTQRHTAQRFAMFLELEWGSCMRFTSFHNRSHPPSWDVFIELGSCSQGRHDARACFELLAMFQVSTWNLDLIYLHDSSYHFSQTQTLLSFSALRQKMLFLSWVSCSDCCKGGRGTHHVLKSWRPKAIQSPKAKWKNEKMKSYWWNMMKPSNIFEYSIDSDWISSMLRFARSVCELLNSICLER
jgi:hypothetical protein